MITLLRVDNGQPFVARASMIPNGDGSVSFQLDDQGWVGQEPNQYGVRHDQHDGEPPKAYQRATVTGTTAVFLTRPQDVPMVYLLGLGKAY